VGDVVQPSLEQIDDVLVVQADIDIAALLAGAYQSLIAQATQLMRDRRGAQSDSLHQLSEADVALYQDGKDAHPRRVAEGREQACEIVGGLLRDRFEGISCIVAQQWIFYQPKKMQSIHPAFIAKPTFTFHYESYATLCFKNSMDDRF
jgi:hypothetical protein